MKKVISLYSSAYSGLTPSTWLLSLVMLVNRCGTMVFPFMTLYLTESLGYSISKAGFIMAVFGMGAICGGLLGGKLTDKFGFYRIQLFTLAGGGLMFFILGQVKSYPLLCVTTFVLTLVNDSFRPANAAAIAHYSTEENRTRSYSLNRLAINLGWAFGGALGGFIAAKNYQLLFWIDGFTNIGAAIMLWVFLSPTKNKATAKAAETVDLPIKGSAYSDKPYIAFIVFTILFAFSFFQLFSTLPVFYRQNMHLTEQFIGVLMATNGILIALFEMIAIHNLEGKRNNLQYITMGVLLTGASFVVFNILPGAETLALTSILIGTVGEILSMPFMNSYWISRSDVSNRGQYAGLYTVAWSVAQVLGPYSGALIAQHFGFTTLWWFIGVICVLSAAGYRWLMRKTQPLVVG